MRPVRLLRQLLKIYSSSQRRWTNCSGCALIFSRMEMELACQMKEEERLKEEAARLAQVAAKGKELVRMYFTAVAESLSDSSIKILEPLVELLQPFPQPP
ncbi:hypothetical protein C1H46_005294 [Malus baccata]|uniref:Uncharacterized protein n=1 Tax=Malus baccata TaxID=106549 RepID=A0A540NDN6_MALBA|nr:hypothetical protein C1H46_005294 [Malus baccata]